MKCLYCKKESTGKFCSMAHRLKYEDGLKEAIDTVSPILHSRKLTDDEIQLQKEFLKRKRSA